MTSRQKESLSAEEKRERVSQVMDSWQSYPDFARLFAALLNANGISLGKFAVDYAQATGTSVSHTKIKDIRFGFRPPTYQFVADLADHALLSLDPERLRPAGAAVPAGEHRTALFAAAGLIEVTPYSIRHWNQEVLAGWQRRCRDHPGDPKPAWQELMHKLLDFHTQGRRWSLEHIAHSANQLTESECQLDGSRVNQLLNAGAVPTAAERLGLARVAGLSLPQIELVERAVEDGTLSLSPRLTSSAFSALLTELLGRLGASHISQQQLSLRTIAPGETEPGVSAPTLSAWRLGRTEPTLATLRALVYGLQRCGSLVTQEEIDQLVSLAGFSLGDLAATTHDLVARIDGATRLKPLLSRLRNAADLNVPMSDVPSRDGYTGSTNGATNYEAMLRHWENEASAASPSQSQLLDLLTSYNQLLRAKGQVELNAAEIEKIVEVARRDRQEGLERGFRRRAHEHRPPSSRRVIRPDFDGSPSR